MYEDILHKYLGIKTKDKIQEQKKITNIPY